ncbi:MAG: M50 family metallopeptidase [Anaerolineales bacterium]
MGSFVIFLLVLSGLVFVHELGHFVVARYFKIHIEEFGIGFPPRLVGFVRDAEGKLRVFFGMKAPKAADPSASSGGGPRTIYSLNAIPLGGFVRPTGEDDPLVPGGLASAPKRARIAVLAAGPGFNLIFAFLIFVAGFRLGWPDRVYVDSVAPGSPAEQAGLQAKDVILRADGNDIHYPQQLSQVTYSHLGQPVEIVVDRNGQSLTLNVTPRTQWPEGQGPMGITMGRSLVTNYTLPQAIGRAGREIAYQFEYLIHLPGQLIRQQIPVEAARPCGPVCLNDLTREAVSAAQEVNALFPILQLIGLVSVALAITNLLPLPALDGGRILFVLIEVVRGRRLDPAREGMVHLVGLVMLLALMIVITYQDIVNPIIPR